MSQGIHYRVEVLDPHAHLFSVTLRIAQPQRRVRVSLPVWIPGSYLVREFAQHIQRIDAACDGLAADLRQLDKNTWEATVPVDTQALVIRAEVYAFDASVRTAYLDTSRGFFNPTSLCLRVHGREAEPHTLELVHGAHTKGWQAATGLPAFKTRRDGFGVYQASDYDELADAPFELGPFWSGRFTVRGVKHRFVVSGAGPGFDGERLLRDTQAICTQQIDFWHPNGEKPPFKDYVFLLHATHDGYGGLEHRNSTALICKRSDLPLHAGPVAPASPAAALKASDGYTTLLGLISHEYFHTWNVKRLRPHEFARYDYDRENHTELLWLFEGFTSYYDDLSVLRTGLIDTPTYLQLLAKTINQVQQTPGRLVQSVAQASFEAWTKYYRIHENTPNATVSYYTKGALVALCLDLTLRLEGHSNLDQVMRALYQRCQGGPMKETDLLSVLRQLGKRSYAQEVQAWVHGTDDLPLRPLLEAAGVHWHEEPAPTAQQLGLRVSESEGLHIKNVLTGSAAHHAGLAAGDEWLAVELEDPAGHQPQAWRVKTLLDVLLYARSQANFTALVSRQARLVRCPMAWPTPQTVVRLARLPHKTDPAQPEIWPHAHGT